MHPALWISKTGLDAAQTDVSVVSNNLANASTIGFKKDRAVFEDLLYQNINQPGGRSSADTELPSGLMLGAGSKVVATQKTHTQGNLITTDNALDISIQGQGFFEIEMPDGSLSYTRNGQFTLNDQGQIVTPGAGFVLQPAITGLEGIGSLSQGTLETSNVNVTEELVNLIESQRLYEMNSKVISAVDQMLGQVIQQL